MKNMRESMFHSIYKISMPSLLIIIFVCYAIFSSPDSYAQGFYKINDKIGGNGSSTSQPENTSDNSTTIIIIGAAIIAGFLVYKLVLNKDTSAKVEKKDSTSSDESSLIKPIDESNNITLSAMKKLQKMPVNFFVSIQKPDILIPERKFIMGISYNF